MSWDAAGALSQRRHDLSGVGIAWVRSVESFKYLVQHLDHVRKVGSPGGRLQTRHTQKPSGLIILFDSL